MLIWWDVDLVGVDLVGVALMGVDFMGIDFVGVDLMGMNRMPVGMSIDNFVQVFVGPQVVAIVHSNY